MAANEGVLVEFRDHDSEELLWGACLQSLPQEGDTLAYAATGEALQDYKAEKVYYRFWQPIGQGVPVPGEPSTVLCQCRPVVFISVIP